MSDFVWFVVLPYLAVLVAVGGGIYRYYTDRYSYSSQSSQFLENRTLFWGSVPWHYGIMIVLLAHFLAALFPGFWGQVIGQPTRLYILEVTGLALGVITIVGLVALIVRRIRFPRIRVVTSHMDWVLLAFLLFQVVLGLWVALYFRWGSAWYLVKAQPWLVSLVTFDPEIQNVETLPLVVKLHLLGGFGIIALFPFTRLVHLVTVPVSYLWRPYQLVIWNRRKRVSRT